MIRREPHFYSRFSCLGGSCPLTCCRDWEIVLDERAMEEYRTAPGALRPLIADNLVTDDEGDVCFRLRPDGLCALLDGDGLCPIQRHWGEEHLCDHCGAYPRFIEEYGCLTEACQAVSCPEAARLVMTEGIFPLAEADDGAPDAPFDGVDGELLEGLIQSRDTVFSLLTRPGTPIWARLGALLTYADDLQDCIDFGLPLSCDAPDACPDLPDRQTLSVRLLERFAALDPLRPEWPQLLARQADALRGLSRQGYAELEARYASACPEWEIRLERFACCFVFRHWPKVVNDDLLYGRAALAAAACLILHHLSLLHWAEHGALSLEEACLLWARFSREVEHLEENFDAMAEEFYDRELWPFTGE